jgi:chitinase
MDPVTSKLRTLQFKGLATSRTHFSILPIAGEETTSFLQATRTLLFVLSYNSWADFQNPFVGDGVNPQNTSSSPANDLGLCGQFTKLMANTSNGFRLQLAVGGWTWSANFSLAVRTASSRASFAQSIVTLFQQWPVFSGVSFDWEYLSNNGVNYGNAGNVTDPSDDVNFAAFLTLLKSQFAQQGWYNHSIALCCTPAPEKLQFNVPLLVPLIDEFHVMTYEYPLSLKF